MPGDKSKRSYWDSTVFLAWLSREQKDDHAVIVGELLEAARKGDTEIITSMLTVTEVAFVAQEKQARSPSTAELSRIERLWEHPSVRLVEFHRLVAEGARDLIRKSMSRGLSLQPADAIHLSSASRYRCEEVLTYDAKWPTYGTLVGVPIGEPAIAQGVLDYGDKGTGAS